MNSEIGGGGYKWWTAKLRPILQHYQGSFPAPNSNLVERFLAQHIISVEYFPYHSHRWSYRIPRIESQSYTRYLVEQAMARGAMIIVMRSFKLWKQAIPTLDSYPQRYPLNSAQNIIISPKNCPEGYPKIIEVLDQKR